ALATTGALVHVGVPTSSHESELLRDDGHLWAAAVRTTGGLIWDAAIAGDDGARAQRRGREVFEEWVRPLRIDLLRVVAPGRAVAGLGLRGAVDEGEGIRDRCPRAAALPWVRVGGELWAAPVRQALTCEGAHGRLWSALVFGSELLHDRSEEEMMPLAWYGG